MPDQKSPFAPSSGPVVVRQRMRIIWPAQQRAALRKLSLYLYLPLAVALLVVVAVSQELDIPFEQLTRDPAATFDAPFYTGLLSQIGVLVWGASTAICLFCWLLLRPYPAQTSRQSFWLASGLVTGLLLMDDLFLIHESVAWHLLGINERPVFSLYGLILLTYLWWYRHTIWQTDYLLFALSFMLFGVSLGIDQQDLPLSGVVVIEDGLKLFGIMTWCWYFIQLGMQHMRLAQRLQ